MSEGKRKTRLAGKLVKQQSNKDGPMDFANEFEFHTGVYKTLLKAEGGQTDIVVRRPFEHLAREIQRIFKSQPDVNVIIDRRYSERRGQSEQQVEKERRSAERRQPKEKLVDVVITVRSGS